MWYSPLLLMLLAVLPTFGCEQRYEIAPAAEEAANVVYRLDRKTGEVCAFDYSDDEKPAPRATCSRGVDASQAMQ